MRSSMANAVATKPAWTIIVRPTISAPTRSCVVIVIAPPFRIQQGLGSTNGLRSGLRHRRRDRSGRNPREIFQETCPEQNEKRFGEFTEEYIASVEAGRKSSTHRQQWSNSLRDHAAGLMEIPLRQIDTDQVSGVLQPIWPTVPEDCRTPPAGMF
ncbi:phage integrase central domain-containing protein [Novosphingobium aquimarinum]|uniref:phage integrase central domain-containing protein n=1 Tax=Novosphingobium aquimarinum TaxID=2682494 RepID=UPI0038CDCA12